HVLGSRNWPWNLQRLLPTIRGVQYHGMVGGREKRKLLARARCLIFPVRYPEPFGVAVTEALVSGGYVVGTPHGALPGNVTPAVGQLSTAGRGLGEAGPPPGRLPPPALPPAGVGGRVPPTTYVPGELRT